MSTPTTPPSAYLSSPPTKPVPTLTNALTSLPVLHLAEAELLFHAAAIRYARIPHEGLRHICADAGKAMREADRMADVGEVAREWMAKLEAEKERWEEERWEEEKRGARERDRREGVWGASVVWLDE